MRTFEKPALTVEQQLQRLIDRGLEVTQPDRACHFLQVVSYFRLSAYMRPFESAEQLPDGEHRFHPGTRLRDLTTLYDFDRRLRLLVIDAIERIEVATRAIITNHMCVQYGPHWYIQAENFNSNYRHHELMDEIARVQQRAVADYERECQQIENSRMPAASKQNRLARRRKESYARHYVLTYNTPTLMPAWAALEELTLGQLSHLYKGLARDQDRKSIAHCFGLTAPLLTSWLHTLTTIRNYCAHHARLWNRELGIKPKFPESQQVPWPHVLRTGADNRRLFPVLALLCILMRKVSPNTSWDHRLAELLRAFPTIHLPAMGFPEHWLEDSFWQPTQRNRDE